MKRIAISRRILRYASIAVLAFGFSAAPAAQRGVNMAGADFAGHKIPGIHGTDYGFNSAPSYQYLGGKSLKQIRVPTLWERLQRTLGGTLETDYLNGIKNNVAWAKANGCSVIIDLHNYGHYAASARLTKAKRIPHTSSRTPTAVSSRSRPRTFPTSGVGSRLSFAASLPYTLTA